MTVALFGLATPLSLVEQPLGRLGLPSVLALGICLYSSLRLGHLLARGERRFLTFTYFAFVYVWFGLATVAQLDANRFFFVEMFLGRTFRVLDPSDRAPPGDRRDRGL